jgi:succinylglutamic semialdehyde dehydrogenase
MSFSIKGNYFNGDFQQPTTGGLNRSTQYIEKFCPANLENRLWKCLIDNQHIDAVLESAQKAFAPWQQTPLAKKIQFITSYAEHLASMKQSLAEALSLETGRPLYDSTEEIDTALSHLPVLIQNAQNALNIKGVDIFSTETIKGHLEYRPLGPCLIIASAILPVLLINHQVVNALLAGNTVIIKPSEKTCYTAQLLMECIHRAGLPAGAVNLLQGDQETAKRLLKEKSIKGVYFTGTKDHGEQVMEITQGDLNKQVTLALGCKNVTIVHEDAKSPQIYQELIQAAFLSSGQRCNSTSIVAIHRSLSEAFINEFHRLAKNLVIDHPLDFEKEPFMGPVIDKATQDNYLLFIGMAKREGIEEIMRGKELQKKFKGYYITPSVHYTENFNPKSVFLTNELLGPNCIFLPYDDVSNITSLINKSPFGHTTSLFTKNQEVIKFCHDNLVIGRLNINLSTLKFTPQLPLQAVRTSANYRPAGFCTLDAFLRPYTYLSQES